MRRPSPPDAQTLDAILETVRAVARRRLDRDTRLALDAADEFPRALIDEVFGPEIALHLVMLPREVGGLGGGAVAQFRVSEELARIDLGVGTSLLVTCLGIDPLVVGGTDEQKQRWLGRVADEGLLVAYAVTEPAAGSDVASLRTTAEPLSDGCANCRAYRLNGTKQFITNGGEADLFTVLARTPAGPSFFVIERGTPGLSSGPPELKHGIRASNTTQVILEDVEVPADQLIGGEEGKGLVQAGEVFGFTRLMVAACGLGVGEEALARAVAYGRERHQFGEPLVAKQGFTHKLLVPHAVRLEAARAYCEDIARRLDEGEGGLSVEGSVAKYFATEAGVAATSAALQAHGGYGYIREYELEKMLRDVRITTIYEGTSEIQQNIIGMYRWRGVVRSKGEIYRAQARALRAHEPADRALVARESAALAADALAELVLDCHRHRLPRQQHVLFELARMAAEVETAIALARKVAALDPADPTTALLDPSARLHAGDAARAVMVTGFELLGGSGRVEPAEVKGFHERIHHDRILATVAGRLADMDLLARALSED